MLAYHTLVLIANYSSGACEWHTNLNHLILGVELKWIHLNGFAWICKYARQCQWINVYASMDLLLVCRVYRLNQLWSIFSLSFEIDVNQFRSKQICSMVFVWIKIIRNKRQFSSYRWMLKRTILVASYVWYPQKCYTSILVIYLYFETWVDENSFIVEITVQCTHFNISY